MIFFRGRIDRYDTLIEESHFLLSSGDPSGQWRLFFEYILCFLFSLGF